MTELWSEIVAGADLPEGSIRLWLDSCVPIAAEDDAMTVEAPNPYTQQYITANFLGRLQQSAVERGLGKGIKLTSPEGEDKPQLRKRAKEALVPPAAAGMNLNPNYTFERFVVGKSNRLAHAASLAVAEMPGKAYNPLFIWGGVGLGKTHMMHAMCHYAMGRSHGLKVLYLSSEKFLNDFVQALTDNRSAQFQERYRSVDILLIDDIQFLGGKKGSQEEFFHTFNSLHEGNKQLVICSDRHPSELQNIEDRLISRFTWGLVTDIQPPDLETRIAILKKKAMLQERDVPDEVTHFLAQHIPSNIRELEGALNRVIANSEIYSEPITIERASEWLKDILRMDVKGPVTIEDIKNAVAEKFGVGLDELASSRRTAELAQARQIAMFLCREMTDASLQQIASAFRKKDHTTVIHANRRIGELIRAGNAEVKQIVDNLKNKL